LIINQILEIIIILLMILMNLFYFTYLFFFVLLVMHVSFRKQLMIHIRFDMIGLSTLINIYTERI